MRKNLIRTTSLFLIPLTLICSVAHGGHETHGGDTVLCKDDGESPYKGYFNLDYLLTYRKSNSNADVVTPVSWEDSRDRIKAILEKKHKALADSFSAYLSFLNNFDDRLKDRIWEESSFGLVVVKPGDEPYQLIDQKIPKNCYSDNEARDISLIRTITREKRGKTITYSFDPDIMSALPPLQTSYLHIHEWMRDHTNDEKIIRRINRLLHSDAVEQNDYDLERAVANIGLKVGGDSGFVPICERTPVIADLFEAKFGLGCAEISGATLQRVNEHYDFSYAHIRELARGDFSGLRYLKSILLANNELSLVPRGAFHDLEFQAMESLSDRYQQTYIDLSKNQIKVLEPGSFTRLESVSGISLYQNQLTRVETGTFVAIRGSVGYGLQVNLSNNAIESLGDGAFMKVMAEKVDLSHNKLVEVNSAAFTDPASRFDIIDFSFNHIRRVPADLTKMQSVQIDFSHNRIEKIANGDFSDVRRDVKLSHNLITEVGATAFDCQKRGYWSYAALDLSNNQLRAIPETAIPNWKKCFHTIDLRGNPFNQEWKHWLQSQLGDRLRID